MKIAVMGGAGYIGSHTIVELYKAGHSVVVIDNLVNSSSESLRRVAELVGSPIPFVNAELHAMSKEPPPRLMRRPDVNFPAPFSM